MTINHALLACIVVASACELVARMFALVADNHSREMGDCVMADGGRAWLMLFAHLHALVTAPAATVACLQKGGTAMAHLLAMAHVTDASVVPAFFALLADPNAVCPADPSGLLQTLVQAPWPHLARLFVIRGLLASSVCHQHLFLPGTQAPQSPFLTVVPAFIHHACAR